MVIKMLVLEPCAGLSNRILSIATAYRLAEETKHKLVVLWDIDGAVGTAIENLFSLPEDIKIKAMTKLPYGERPFLRGKSDFERYLLRRRTNLFWNCDDVERMQREQTREQIQKQLENKKLIYVKAYCELTKIEDKSIFSIFKPSEEIVHKGKTVFQHIDDKTIGMHIRRTDHAEAIRRSPLELFRDTIERVLEEGAAEKIFLATDDRQTELTLQREFPNRIICYEGKRFTRKDKDGMQDGLIDMLALAKCREIYGSYGSTFSRMASYLGNCELHILQSE